MADQISGLYQNFLGRAPDTEGLNYWTNQLNTGALSLDQISQAIQNSPEAMNRLPQQGLNAVPADTNSPLVSFGQPKVDVNAPTVDYPKPPAQQTDQISQLYQNILGRSPDTEGYNYWNNALAGGQSIGAIQNAFANSPEALQRQASIAAAKGTNDYTPITNVNPNIPTTEYPRPPTSTGRVIDPNVPTTEYPKPPVNNANVGAVTKMYQDILGRAPDQAGLDYWTNALAGGATLGAIQNAIVNSPESVERASGQIRGLNPTFQTDEIGNITADSARSLYKSLLGRDISDAELAIVTQNPIGDVQRAVLASPEFAKANHLGGYWISSTSPTTTYDEYGNANTEYKASPFYVPPSVAKLPGVADALTENGNLISKGYNYGDTARLLPGTYPEAYDANGQLNQEALIKAIEADPKKWAQMQLHAAAYDLQAAKQVSDAGFVNSGVSNESVQAVIDRARQTADWLKNNGVSQSDINKVYNEGTTSAEKWVGQSIKDQKDTGGWMNEWFGPAVEALVTKIAPMVVLGGVTAGAGLGPLASAGVMGAGGTGVSLANGMPLDKALLAGGISGLTAGALSGLAGAEGAIDSGLAGSTVDQASVDAFLSGASGKLTPAELADYANFFADQGYNVNGLDRISSWPQVTQDAFASFVDSGKYSVEEAFNKIQNVLSDSGVPGSGIDQATVDAMLKENPEYAQFFKGQGYNVDAAKDLTNVDNITNKLVEYMGSARENTDINALIRDGNKLAMNGYRDVIITGNPETMTDFVPEGGPFDIKDAMSKTGLSEERINQIIEVNSEIKDAAKIVAESPTQAPETTVTELYKTLLDRAPDAAGLKYWTSQIATGALTASQVASSIIASSEFGNSVGAGAGGTGTQPGKEPGAGPGGDGEGGAGGGGSTPGVIPVTPVTPPVTEPVTEPLPDEVVTETPTEPVTKTPIPKIPSVPSVPTINLPKITVGNTGSQFKLPEGYDIRADVFSAPGKIDLGGKFAAPQIYSVGAGPTVSPAGGLTYATGGSVDSTDATDTTEEIVSGNVQNIDLGGKFGASKTYAEGGEVMDGNWSPISLAQVKRGILQKLHGSLPKVTADTYAEGGHVPEFYSEGGLNNRYVSGDGDGTSDDVPAMLANGEFVIPADVVSALGNGSNDSGAAVLDEFMSTIRAHKQKHDPKELPPDSLGPLAYMKKATKKAGK